MVVKHNVIPNSGNAPAINTRPIAGIKRKIMYGSSFPWENDNQIGYYSAKPIIPWCYDDENPMWDNCIKILES